MAQEFSNGKDLMGSHTNRKKKGSKTSEHSKLIFGPT